MFIADAFGETNTRELQDKFINVTSSKCQQVARELRVIGDELEERFQQEANQGNKWRLFLENITLMVLITNELLLH